MEYEVQFGTLIEYRGEEEYAEIPREVPQLSSYECGFVSLHDSRVITVIGKCAFMMNEKLKGVIIPDSVMIIDDGAFSYCQSLAEVKLGQGVKSIGKNAFSGCESLKSITIPESVEKIEKDAFRWINDLTICGKKGSEAERYAKENGIAFEEIDLNS